jgi:lipid-binding SYLF domain-containing protein
VLQVAGEPVAYYATAGASFGLQLGAQYKSEVILFMNQDALDKFRASPGWEVGVDGSVAVIQLGAGGKFDSKQLTQPVIAFIFSNQGLMYNLTLEGSKITRIAR